MPMIKIIATPPGQAPKEIREKWVGVSITLYEPPKKEETVVQTGTQGGPAENMDGYVVATQEAFLELAKKHPKAAEWWEANLNPLFAPRLCFKKEVCELIPDTTP